MSIPYAGGTIVNTTYTCDGTLAGLLTKINTELKNAGWAVVSGDGTADVLFSTATTPQGCNCRFRFYSAGSGNCLQITLKNNGSPSTLTSQIAYLLATTSGLVYRIIANKYQFFIFASGAAYRQTSRVIVMGGVPYITPAGNLTALNNDLQLGWMEFSGSTDTDTNMRTTIRNTLSDPLNDAWFGSSLLTGYMLNYTNSNQSTPRVLTIPASFSSQAVSSGRYLDNSFPQREAEIGWSSTNVNNGDFRVIGQLWDSMVLGGQQTGEQTITSGSHTFLIVTDMCTTAPYGSLCVAVN